MYADGLVEVKNLLGPSGYIEDPVGMAPYLTSWRNGWTGKSPLVALPSSTSQVSELLKICQKNYIPVVPQGGNTGLVGGAIPSALGLEMVVSLSRMNKIRALDKVSSTVTCEAGVILQSLQDAAAEAGFLFPLSMASQGSAQIGGAISTNAGGTAVLRYGNMRDLVMGVEAVLIDGRVYSSLAKLPKDNTGYDLGRLVIGAEGTLAIVTAAKLKLFPELRQSLTAVIAVPSVEAALDLFHDFRRECSEYLSAFEIMSRPALELVIKHIADTRMPGDAVAPFYLLVELGSSSGTVDLKAMFENAAVPLIEKGQVIDAVVAGSGAQAKQFWHLREHISEALRKEGQGIHFDISLPQTEIADFLRDMEPKIKALAPKIMVAPFGHIGDGNIHYNMCFSSNSTADFANVKKHIQEVVYREIRRRTGSISAEHGIGLERKADLALAKPILEIELMKKVKSVLDPARLMNAGKIFD